MLRHKLHIRAFFQKDPRHTQAKVYNPPEEPDRVLDAEQNEVVPPKGLARRSILRRLYRAMLKGWRPYARHP